MAREQRERERKELLAAKKIQATWRGHLARKRLFASLRASFQVDPSDPSRSASSLQVFYSPRADFSRFLELLELLSLSLVRQGPGQASWVRQGFRGAREQRGWLYQAKGVLGICHRGLRRPDTSQAPLLLQFLRVFTNPSTYKQYDGIASKHSLLSSGQLCDELLRFLVSDGIFESFSVFLKRPEHYDNGFSSIQRDILDFWYSLSAKQYYEANLLSLLLDLLPPHFFEYHSFQNLVISHLLSLKIRNPLLSSLPQNHTLFQNILTILYHLLQELDQQHQQPSNDPHNLPIAQKILILLSALGSISPCIIPPHSHYNIPPIHFPPPNSDASLPITEYIFTHPLVLSVSQSITESIPSLSEIFRTDLGNLFRLAMAMHLKYGRDFILKCFEKRLHQVLNLLLMAAEKNFLIVYGPVVTDSKQDSNFIDSVLYIMCQCCLQLLKRVDETDLSLVLDPASFIKFSLLLQRIIQCILIKPDPLKRALSMSSPVILPMTYLLKELSLRDHRLQGNYGMSLLPLNHWDLLRSVMKGFTNLEDFEAYTPNSEAGIDGMEIDHPTKSMKEIETNLIPIFLNFLPFVFTTSEKVKIFHHWIKRDHERQGRGDPSQGIEITIRRNYFVQDSFAKLFPNRENLRKYFKIQFVNQEGLLEAGIGGGVFKEFLTSLVKEAFSPQFGLFIQTPNNEWKLLPNRDADKFQENIKEKFEFLGAITGKLIYESTLVELPFASFFLKLLLGHEIHFSDLSEYDPNLYKGLKKLDNLPPADLPSLDLNFTVVTKDPFLKKDRVEELIPDGANYHLKTGKDVVLYQDQITKFYIKDHIDNIVNDFRRGLMMVVSYDWLRFFNSYELGLLISGNKSKIDLDDLRQHTKYSNGYHDSHRTILMFWQAMYELPQEHLASFLKFVTSCSKAPLLGFKELSPPFCVHKSSIGYMPSATTCVNQFKLPPYEDYQTLKEKLLYAITSNSGFELS